MRALKASPKGDRSSEDKKLVGLRNPGNWCYGNSSLQCMFGTSGFAADLWSGDWQEQYKVPMKEGEKIQHPQLLAKILANLFHWMDKGHFEIMEARTLMVRHLDPLNPTTSEPSPSLSLFTGFWKLNST
jgi:ubiquitin carboxyl-terminal hydrolase 8